MLARGGWPGARSVVGGWPRARLSLLDGSCTAEHLFLTSAGDADAEFIPDWFAHQVLLVPCPGISLTHAQPAHLARYLRDQDLWN